VNHERRPQGPYFEQRGTLLSQGDLFIDVPLAYPMPADEMVVDAEEEGARRFLSGPLSIGAALLITPTCSMRAQGGGRDYAHPVRTLVPLRPAEELSDLGILDVAKLRVAERRDSLINYLYLPASGEFGIPESLALLYMPVTLHHDMIAETRLAQMTYEASAQLQKKLAWHSTSILLERNDFDPPMD
jgi:hypothetical protein